VMTTPQSAQPHMASSSTMITDPELLHAHTERARPQRHEREHRPCYYYYPRRDETRQDETRRDEMRRLASTRPAASPPTGLGTANIW
jgi:hypothetical protein